MLIKGLANLVFIGLSLWFVYKEFGIAMFSEKIFWFICMFWVYFNYSLFKEESGDK